MEESTTDVLVIGGGAAGLRAAIAAREAGVDALLVSKTPVGYANCTAVAVGGIAATLDSGGPADGPPLHVQDSVAAGRFINKRELVEVLAEGISEQIYDAERFGVQFSKSGERFIATMAAGHSYPRGLHPRDHAGLGLTRPMRQFALKIGVRFREGVLVTQLLKRDGRVDTDLEVARDGSP
ncbi:MAG TPA: FAD-binding protein, partial [Dehalococcoidia bacterium]|nr:FAD-binding protein [Dehalococcoidia bacterium]